MMIDPQHILLSLIILGLLVVPTDCFTFQNSPAFVPVGGRWSSSDSDVRLFESRDANSDGDDSKWLDFSLSNTKINKNNGQTRRDFATVATSAGFLAAMFPFPELARVAAATLQGPVTVIGANGRTGYECVKALQSRSVAVRACSRTGDFRGGTSQNVEALVCDVTAPATIGPVVADASAVIFAASASKEGGTPAVVDNAGLVAVAKACIDAKVKQLVIVSSGAVTKPSSPVYLFLNVFGKIMEEKIKGEDTVRELYAAGSPADKEGLSYTIVRPGGLTEEETLGSVSGLELNQGDTKSGRIARADVANICVAALYYPELTGRTTLECYNADTGAPLASVGFSNILKAKTEKDNFVSGRECRGTTWKELFSGLEQD